MIKNFVNNEQSSQNLIILNPDNKLLKTKSYDLLGKFIPHDAVATSKNFNFEYVKK